MKNKTTTTTVSAELHKHYAALYAAHMEAAWVNIPFTKYTDKRPWYKKLRSKIIWLAKTPQRKLHDYIHRNCHLGGWYDW